jgi:hypothetical protein
MGPEIKPPIALRHLIPRPFPDHSLG